VPEVHFVRAGRIGMVLLAFALLAMSMLCFYWQRYTEAPLLDFALGVMSFAYSGLLGVYFTILFTRRGSTRSVILALAAGFIAILVQQHYVVDTAGLPASWKSLAFPYQLCIGTAVAFATCLLGSQSKAAPAIEADGEARPALS
jgi:Na+/proline symporter